MRGDDWVRILGAPENSRNLDQISTKSSTTKLKSDSIRILSKTSEDSPARHLYFVGESQIRQLFHELLYRLDSLLHVD